MSNNYVAYLNSLHNLGAGGANALAESQALSEYFSEVYEQQQISTRIVELLKEGKGRVIILTGHAGDGKSTIALDVLKQLRNFPLDKPLDNPLLELETISDSFVKINIVKDMSELSSSQRRNWLQEAFNQDGSWLIISNTGPLLKSLKEYGESSSRGAFPESELLGCLNKQLDLEKIENLTIHHFEKPLTILNLTQVDNSDLGAKILRKLVNHSAWGACGTCSFSNECAIKLNRDALHDAIDVVEERVRWMYTRIGAYEKRLTIRQMIAQLALSITGGSSCQKKTSIDDGDTNRIEKNIENILFSEVFFGNKDGVPWEDARGLEAIATTCKTYFGGHINIKLERETTVNPGFGWAQLPDKLDKIEQKWRSRSSEGSGVRWRYALRRMSYIFGVIKSNKEKSAHSFFDGFLQSPKLRFYDSLLQNKKLLLKKNESLQLKKSCLKLLLEFYSGFNSSQFSKKNDYLYITLRRPDQEIIQPTQIVIKKLDFRDFEINYIDGALTLVFRPLENAQLKLNLPLLDFIERREQGELGANLSPIHQAKLDRFRTELIRDAHQNDYEEIELLRASLVGQINVHTLVLDEESGTLEFI